MSLSLYDYNFEQRALYLDGRLEPSRRYYDDVTSSAKDVVERLKNSVDRINRGQISSYEKDVEFVLEKMQPEIYKVAMEQSGFDNVLKNIISEFSKAVSSTMVSDEELREAIKTYLISNMDEEDKAALEDLKAGKTIKGINLYSYCLFISGCTGTARRMERIIKTEF